MRWDGGRRYVYIMARYVSAGKAAVTAEKQPAEYTSSAASHASGRILVPGVLRREVWAWAMYDFANSGYTTVVLTTVFSAYFVGVVAQGKTWATLAFTAALSVS